MSMSGLLGAVVPCALFIVVQALVAFSVLFDDVDESWPIFIKLSYADPG